MKILVHKDFDYRFPSRAMMHCKAWPEPYSVKREIGEYGIALGCAVEVKKTMTSIAISDNVEDNGETPVLAIDNELAGSDSDADRGAELFDAGTDESGQ